LTVAGCSARAVAAYFVRSPAFAAPPEYTKIHRRLPPCSGSPRCTLDGLTFVHAGDAQDVETFGPGPALRRMKGWHQSAGEVQLWK
jgi:hypothetical protein